MYTFGTGVLKFSAIVLIIGILVIALIALVQFGEQEMIYDFTAIDGISKYGGLTVAGIALVGIACCAIGIILGHRFNDDDD